MKKFFALLLSLTMVLTMLVPMAAAPSSSVDLTEDLLIHYTFDETGDKVLDTATPGGAANDLKLVPGVTRTDGYIGSGALHFDGTAGLSTTLEADPDLKKINTQDKFTVSLWVKHDTSVNHDLPYWCWDSGKSNQMHLFTQNVTFNLCLQNPNGHPYTWVNYYGNGDKYFYYDSVWSNLIVTYDGATDVITYYINGNAYNGSDAMPSSYPVEDPATAALSVMQDFYLGCGGYGGFYAGDMDDFRVYDDVLTADEIAAINDMRPSYDKDLLFHMTFDETNNKVTDSMGVYAPVITYEGQHTRIPGVFGTGLKWSPLSGGATSYQLNFNNPDGAIGTNGVFTWSVWLKFDSTLTDRPGQMMQMGHGPWYTAYVQQPENSNYLYWNTSYGAYAAGYKYYPVVPGQEKYEFDNSGLFPREAQMSDAWFNWTVTYDGTTLTHYVDGIPYMSEAADFDPTDGNLYLGQYGFNGAMDDFRVYDKALSASEVYALVARAKNPDLLFEYKFDETDGTVLRDYDSGNHLTMCGGNTRVPGLVGNALKFNGVSSDPLDTTLSSGLGRLTANKLNNGKLSVSMWVNMEDNGSGENQTLFAFGDPNIHLFVQNGGNIGMWIKGVGGTWAWNAGDINIEGDNGWHHIAVTMDVENDSVIFYINGDKYVGTSDSHEPLELGGYVPAEAYLYLGGYHFNGWQPFKGTMDEVQIFSDVLTDAEVLAMYNAVNDEHTHDYTGAVWSFDLGEDTHYAYCQSEFCTDYENSKKVETCTDGDNDHNCDVCPKQNITGCIDADPKDHKCDICGATGMYGACADVTTKDHKCDHCGATLSECAEGENKDHLCDVCGEELSQCADEDDDHLCDVCEEELSECAEGDDMDHLCHVCGETISECEDSEDDEDHECDVCGAILSDCEDADGDDDHECDVCGAEGITNCKDADPKDHKCDECGATGMGGACADVTVKDHLCDYCGKPLSECAEGDIKDHLCDYCGEFIADAHLFDTEWTAGSAGHYHACTYDGCTGATEAEPHSDSATDDDFLCDVCDYDMAAVHVCTPGAAWEYDEDEHWHVCTDPTCDERLSLGDHLDEDDHLCDVCENELSECADEDDDHLCDICEEELSECADEDDDHFCDVCGDELSECEDEDDDHLCDICGDEFSECADEDDDHLCDICGDEFSECADEDDDHLCDVCGDELSECADEDDDHLCDVCGDELSECADEDDDHFCDVCGDELSECADEDDDHLCDVCGDEVSECEDEDDDHLCDICGDEVSECADEDDDHLCDVCGDELSECEDEDDDHLCDVCGDEVSECEDEDNDHNCDLCGDEVSECEEGTTKDHKCDVCGATVSQCAEGTTKDHKCDVCSKVLGTCADADNDGKCDVCDDDVELDNPPTFDAMTIVAFTALVSTAGVVLTKKRRK